MKEAAQALYRWHSANMITSHPELEVINVHQKSMELVSKVYDENILKKFKHTHPYQKFCRTTKISYQCLIL